MMPCGFAADSEAPMGRQGAASPPVLSRNASHLPFLASLRWPFGIKRTAMMAVVLALLGTVTVALLRELGTTARVDAPASRPPPSLPSRRSRPPKRPTSSELWPIHGDVERSTARMMLGQIFYKINDMDRSSLKKSVDGCAGDVSTVGRLDSGRSSRRPTVERDHEEYLAAIALFQQSAVEVLKMFEDGRDDHLVPHTRWARRRATRSGRSGRNSGPTSLPPN